MESDCVEKVSRFDVKSRDFIDENRVVNLLDKWVGREKWSLKIRQICRKSVILQAVIKQFGNVWCAEKDNASSGR